MNKTAIGAIIGTALLSLTKSIKGSKSQYSFKPIYIYSIAISNCIEPCQNAKMWENTSFPSIPNEIHNMLFNLPNFYFKGRKYILFAILDEIDKFFYNTIQNPNNTEAKYILENHEYGLEKWGFYEEKGRMVEGGADGYIRLMEKAESVIQLHVAKVLFYFNKINILPQEYITTEILSIGLYNSLSDYKPYIDKLLNELKPYSSDINSNLFWIASDKYERHHEDQADIPEHIGIAISWNNCSIVYGMFDDNGHVIGATKTIEQSIRVR